MEAFIETFHIDWKLMLAQAINFGLVFAAFYFLANKPLSKVLKDRREEIGKGVEDAKKNAVLLTETEARYNEALAKARQEAQKIFEEGKKEAAAKRESMLEDARAEVASMIDSGKKTLEAEKIKMVLEAKKEVAELVVSATEKILKEKVDPKDAEKTLKELGTI